MKKFLYIILFFSFICANAQVTPLNQTAFDLLNQQSVSYPYSFVVIGDTREGYDVENDIVGDYESMMSPVFLDILDELKNLSPKPKYIVNLGDAVLGRIVGRNEDTYQQQYPAYHYYISEFMSSTQIPFFTIPGNHEFWVEWGNPSLFLQYIGNLYDYFDYGNTRFIWSNNGMNNYNGTWKNYLFTSDDLDFVNEKLSENNRPPVVFTACHVPLYIAISDTSVYYFDYKLNSFESYYNILKNNNVMANFSGHQHNYQRYMFCEDNIIDMVCGGGGARIHHLDTVSHPPVNLFEHHYLLVTVSSNNRAKVQMYLYENGHNDEAAEYDYIIPRQENEWHQNETVLANERIYYSVYNNMYFAGDNTYFITEPESKSEVTSGRVIRLQKGTHIQSGSKFHAHISHFECNESINFSNLRNSYLYVENNKTHNQSCNEITVTPVPAINILNINNLQLFSYNIEIYNSYGQKLQTLQVSDKEKYKLNIAMLQPGIYFIRLKNKNKIINKKFIKQ